MAAHSGASLARRVAPWLLLAAVLVFVGWKLHTSHFDWAGFAASWRAADLRLLALAILTIYINYVLRAARWVIFLRPALRAAGRPPVRWTRLIGSQFIGFTGLAIFGRIGELIRPALVAQRTGLTFSSQVAVVTVERVFDLGAFALLFSLNLLLSPDLQTLPYHERFHMVGYAIAGLTLVVGLFVAAVRLAGTRIARAAEHLLRPVSLSASHVAREKILQFREGLDVIDTLADFALAAFLSIVLWLTIALSYVLVMKAFPPPVHQLTIAHTIVLLGFSVVGSIVQLPGVGGGAQVGTISALTLLFSIPGGLAVSAGLMLYIITTMSVIPAGLLYARLEGLSLGSLARSRGQSAGAATPSTR